MVRLTDHDDLSRETVLRRLAENELKPWRQKMWCVPAVNGACVARMEDVIDPYAEDPHPQRPVGLFRPAPGSDHRRTTSPDSAPAGPAGTLRRRRTPTHPDTH